MKRTALQIADELLVLRCQEGQEPALRELVDRCQRPFFLHAMHLTGQEEAAGEVTQEAWLAIICGLRRLQDPAMFRAWGYRIVTNKAADWIRRRRGKRAVGGLEENRSAAPGGDVDAAQDARAMLERLSPEQRAILSLRYLEEFDIPRIAEILGIPEGTVKSRLFAARNALRQRMRGESP